MNCAFYDKSMKLCTQSEYTFKNIIGYRDIANLTRNKNGSVIFKMATKDKVNQCCQIIFSQGACLQLKKCHLEYNCAVSNKYIVDCLSSRPGPSIFGALCKIVIRGGPLDMSYWGPLYHLLVTVVIASFPQIWGPLIVRPCATAPVTPP